MGAAVVSSDFERLMVRARQDPAFRRLLGDEPLVALADYDLSETERLAILLPNFGWLIDGQLAGVGRPNTDVALATLREAGVRALVSLSEAPVADALLTAHDLPAAHIPVDDMTAPAPAAIERAVAAINGYLAQGRPVAVHCGAGLGRTGTVLACYLVSKGQGAAAAIAAVRARRPGSIETPEQEAAVAAYADSLAGGAAP